MQKGCEEDGSIISKWSPNWLFVLASILLVGWLFRLTGLGYDSFWGDELRSLQRASLADWQTFYELIKKFNQAPLYEWGALRWWLKLLGERSPENVEFLLRYPSVLFGVLTISSVYALGRRAFNGQIGVISAALFAVAPMHIYYSREVRAYALVALLMTLALYYLLTAIKRQNSGGWEWGAYACLAGASLYAHYYTGLTLLVVNGFVLIQSLYHFNPRLLKKWFLANFAVLALFAPWAPTFWFQIRQHAHEWLEPTSLTELFQIFAYFFADYIALPGREGLALATFVWALFFYGAFVVYDGRQSGASVRRNFSLLASVAILPLILAWGLSFVMGPLIVPRYFIASVPAAIILAAFAFYQLKGFFWRAAIPALLVGFMVYSAYNVANYRWNEDWRSVAVYLHEHTSEDEDVVLIFVPFTFWRMSLDYYYRGDTPVITVLGQVTDESVVANRLADLPSYKRVWILQSARHLSSPSKLSDYAIPGDRYRTTFYYRFAERIAVESRHIHLWLLEGE